MSIFELREVHDKSEVFILSSGIKESQKGIQSNKGIQGVQGVHCLRVGVTDEQELSEIQECI